MRNLKPARFPTVALATAAWIPNSECRKDGASASIARGTPLAAIDTAGSVMVAAPARDAILLVGDPRIQRVLGLIAAPRVFNATLPLEAITLLERESAGLHTVAVSADLPWAADLRELVAEQHPGIRVVLVTPAW
jgi:hypothetical protein